MASTQKSKNDFTLGFLTVLDVESFGACGGLLVVNPIGRPIEFHCTAPVSASRTQEILYGISLKSFLYCEQIGKTLMDQAKSRIDLVVTDQPELKGLETSAEQAIVLLLDKSEQPQTPQKLDNSVKIEIKSESVFNAFAFGCNNDQSQAVTQWLNHFNETLPLDEPFERIEQAIDEAQAVAR